MGKSYSLDLRERIVALVSSGFSRRAAAERFGVRPSCAVKLVKRAYTTGDPAPARQGRPAGGGKLSAHEAFLIARVEAKPDITMPELAAELEAAHGLKATTKLTGLRGRSRRGERLPGDAPFGHWIAQTFIAGLRCGCLTVP
jgi:transposase